MTTDNPCKLTENELLPIVYTLTLQDRGKRGKREFWDKKGFDRLGKPRAVRYWKRRIENNPEDYTHACGVYKRYLTAEAARKTGKIKPPSAAQMAKTLAESMKSWVRNGFKLATEEQLTERMNICKACPHWDGEALASTGRCLKCGCSTQAKLRLAHEKCPLDLWGPIKD